MSRKAYTLFCDDIRQEVGNKLSFIGVYSGVMLVASFPATLPKLCLAMFASTPLSRPFRQLEARVLKGDEVLAEMKIPDEGIAAMATTHADDVDGRLSTVQANIEFTPFQISGPCVIRVRLTTEDGELKSGGLRIELMPAGVKATS